MSCIRMIKQGTIGDTTLGVLPGTTESWVRVLGFHCLIFLHWTDLYIRYRSLALAVVLPYRPSRRFPHRIFSDSSSL